MIWGTSLCKQNLELIINFENEIFPRDFSVTLRERSHWAKSDAVFWNCYVKDKIILSDISFVITTETFYFDFLSKKLHETDIQPYSGIGKPILYFSSLILKKSIHSPILFRNIFREISSYISINRIELTSCFTIASSINNLSIIKKFGFKESGIYLDKYSIMSFDVGFEKSIFNRLIKLSRPNNV